VSSITEGLNLGASRRIADKKELTKSFGEIYSLFLLLLQKNILKEKKKNCESIAGLFRFCGRVKHDYRCERLSSVV
jgi:hypothetical protein